MSAATAWEHSWGSCNRGGDCEIRGGEPGEVMESAPHWEKHQSGAEPWHCSQQVLIPSSSHPTKTGGRFLRKTFLLFPVRAACLGSVLQWTIQSGQGRPQLGPFPPARAVHAPGVTQKTLFLCECLSALGAKLRMMKDHLSSKKKNSLMLSKIANSSRTPVQICKMLSQAWSRVIS